MVTEQKN